MRGVANAVSFTVVLLLLLMYVYLMHSAILSSAEKIFLAEKELGTKMTEAARTNLVVEVDGRVTLRNEGGVRVANVRVYSLPDLREAGSVYELNPGEEMTLGCSGERGVVVVGEGTEVRREQGWWNSEWGYRREVVVDSDLTERDYTLRISLNTEALISQGKMRPDCGDIRVVNEVGEEVPFWVENCDSNDTGVWVRVNIYSDCNRYLYIYYGNPTAEDEADVESTFHGILRGVRLYLSMDENGGSVAQDGSGYGNNGTLEGGAYWDTGVYGSSVALDGADDYVEVPYSPSLDGFSEMSVEAWVNPDENKEQIIVGKSGGYIFGLSADGRLKFNWYSGGYVGWVYGEESVPTGTWTHVVVVFNGTTGKVYFYINGSLDAVRDTNTGSISIFNSPVDIGNSQDLSEYFHGRIDEVHIYPYALNEEEIILLHEYRGFSSPSYPYRIILTKMDEPEPEIYVLPEESA